MGTHTTTFWQNCDRYHDLAKQYYQNIQIKSPKEIQCRLGHFPCTYCGSTVTYYEYNGPSI